MPSAESLLSGLPPAETIIRAGALPPAFPLRPSTYPAMRSAVPGDTGIVLDDPNLESLTARVPACASKSASSRPSASPMRSPHDHMSPIRNERPLPLRPSGEPSESAARMSRQTSSSL